jgi:uroporphyrinogen decarboxylase
VDQPPLRLVGVWADTLERWYREGLPRGADPHEHLGVKPMGMANISGQTLAWPPFERRVLEEHEDHTVEIDDYGRKVKRFKASTSVPEWLEYPIESPADLRRVMDERFAVDQAALDARFPAGWEDSVRRADTLGVPVAINVGWYYWTLRSLAGVETASYLVHDAPALVEELFERINVIALDGITRAVGLTRLDVMIFGEDIAYKNGPFISPAMHQKLLSPRYRRIMDLARAHGCDVGWMGSDGDLRLLVPQYLEVGVNCLEPCEVAAGMVPVELRRQFGPQLLMVGGLDKRAVAVGPKAIDSEIERNRSLMEEGGYLPSIDHSVSADISWSNYCYFIEALMRALGIA